VVNERGLGGSRKEELKDAKPLRSSEQEGKWGKQSESRRIWEKKNAAGEEERSVS